MTIHDIALARGLESIQKWRPLQRRLIKVPS